MISTDSWIPEKPLKYIEGNTEYLVLKHKNKNPNLINEELHWRETLLTKLIKKIDKQIQNDSYKYWLNSN